MLTTVLQQYTIHMERRCEHSTPHTPLRGRAPNGQPLTRATAAYSSVLIKAIVRVAANVSGYVLHNMQPEREVGETAMMQSICCQAYSQAEPHNYSNALIHIDDTDTLKHVVQNKNFDTAKVRVAVAASTGNKVVEL